MLRHPCILGGPQTKGDKIRSACLTPAFSEARKRAKRVRHPCILGGPQTKGDRIEIGCRTLAVSGAQERAEMLFQPCILGGPLTNHDKIRIGRITLAFSRAQEEGKNATSPLHSLGSPNKGGQNQNRTPHPCRLGAQKRAEMLRHSCILRDPQTKTDKIRSACLTLASSGAQKRAVMLRHPYILGDP